MRSSKKYEYSRLDKASRPLEDPGSRVGILRLVVAWLLIFLLFPALIFRVAYLEGAHTHHSTTHAIHSGDVHQPGTPTPDTDPAPNKPLLIPPEHVITAPGPDLRNRKRPSRQTNLMNSAPHPVDVAPPASTAEPSLALPRPAPIAVGIRLYAMENEDHNQWITRLQSTWLPPQTVPNVIFFSALDLSDSGPSIVPGPAHPHARIVDINLAARNMSVESPSAFDVVALSTLYQSFPDAQTFILTNPDSYLFLSALSKYLTDSELLYMGKPYLVTSCAGFDKEGKHPNGLQGVLFAFLGSGGVFSRSTVRQLIKALPTCGPLFASCARDMLTAMCLARFSSVPSPTNVFGGALNYSREVLHFHSRPPNALQTMPNPPLSTQSPLSFGSLSHKDFVILNAAEQLANIDHRLVTYGDVYKQLEAQSR
eukprot:c47271_g1_i1.p1 GENE.c47271_g1_i1~~c47271_g1_i1.p1  ORF type:complete len:424 (+),score=63.78 c47271_g1_i1:98-1369(+)